MNIENRTGRNANELTVMHEMVLKFFFLMKNRQNE